MSDKISKNPENGKVAAPENQVETLDPRLTVEQLKKLEEARRAELRAVNQKIELIHQDMKLLGKISGEAKALDFQVNRIQRSIMNLETIYRHRDKIIKAMESIHRRLDEIGEKLKDTKLIEDTRKLISKTESMIRHF